MLEGVGIGFVVLELRDELELAESKFWLRRPRFTYASATLRRSCACSTARSTALSCTRFSASSTSPTSPPAAYMDRFELGSHDLFRNWRGEDFLDGRG